MSFVLPIPCDTKRNYFSLLQIYLKQKLSSQSSNCRFALFQDLLIHVRDLSHPDHKNQLKNVLRVLSNLRVNPQLLGNIIEVRNKMDKIWKT